MNRCILFLPRTDLRSILDRRPVIVKVANRNPLSEGEEAPIVVPMIVGENHVIEFVDSSQCEDL
jgi:hypothetical protein